MSRWFRFYDEAINDPKIIRLSDALYRTWSGLLCIASKCGGTLPAIDDIALMLRMKPTKVSKALLELIDHGLLDDVGGKLAPHNWNGRQFKSDVSTERVKRFRNGKGNVSSDVSETAPYTEQKTEQKKDAASAAPELPLTPDAEVYHRGKQVLGPSAGGMIKRLIAAKGGNLALARAALETASTKKTPREYIGAIINAKATETQSWESAVL